MFSQNFDQLVKAIDSPTQFAEDFFDEGLISRSTRDAVLEVGNTRVRHDKAAQLLKEVHAKVKVDPKVLPRVIQILRQHVTSKQLGEEMAAQGISLASI